jgi:hypothetical protein
MLIVLLLCLCIFLLYRRVIRQSLQLQHGLLEHRYNYYHQQQDHTSIIFVERCSASFPAEGRKILNTVKVKK